MTAKDPYADGRRVQRDMERFRGPEKGENNRVVSKPAPPSKPKQTHKQRGR